MIRFLSVLILGLMIAGCRGKEPIANDLLDSAIAEMSSMTHMAYWQEEACGMVSSYDRTGGNDDGKYFFGTRSDGSPVLVSLKGPGCIRRIWLTGMQPEAKFYFHFDGEKTPRFTRTYAELTGKGTGPWSAPICELPSGAGYCYLPVTYAKSLEISTDPVQQGQFFFYQINYLTLPKGTAAKSLTQSDLDLAAPRLKVAANIWNASLSNLTVKTAIPEGAGTLLEPGKEIQLLSETGPAIVDELMIQLTLPAGLRAVDRNALLRAIVLRVYWDDCKDPSIETPFGDFFCNGIRPRSFRSMPIAVEQDTYVCRFPMPFRSGMRLCLQNDTSLGIKAAASVTQRKLEWSGQEMYFHATWRQAAGRGIPHEILNVTGEGRYAGCYLASIGMDGSWNILEGDESIYRDGETAAGMHGTGLEDYFNGGWYYNNGTFAMPFAGALERAGIRTTQFRFHVPDRVEFRKRIRVNIEFGHANASRGYMSSVAYWYGRKPVTVPDRLPAVQQRLVPADPLERDSILCEMFERERLGRLGEAKDLCREYIEKYPGTAEAGLIELRMLAYDEVKNGYESVKEGYTRFEQESNFEAVKRQAGQLKWFHQAPSNALMISHINGNNKIWLDGVLIGEGDSAIDVLVFPLTLTPGRHVLALEVTSIRPDSWVSMNVRGHGFELRTDDLWQVTTQPAGNWKQVGGAGAEWKISPCGGPLPWMRYFQFKPNALVLTQHRRQQLYVEKGWAVGDKYFFRREFEVPKDVN